MSPLGRQIADLVGYQERALTAPRVPLATLLLRLDPLTGRWTCTAGPGLGVGPTPEAAIQSAHRQLPRP